MTNKGSREKVRNRTSEKTTEKETGRVRERERETDPARDKCEFHQFLHRGIFSFILRDAEESEKSAAFGEGEWRVVVDFGEDRFRGGRRDSAQKRREHEKKVTERENESVRETERNRKKDRSKRERERQRKTEIDKE